MREQDISITPSLVDRLIDLDPRSAAEAPKSRFQSLRDLKQSVRRDMEWLLNARSVAYDIDEQMEELNRSLAVYGLPDFTGVGVMDPGEQDRMTISIKKAIELFEPRFINLRVYMEPLGTLDKQLRFRIEANLDIEPTPEPVVFDTVLNSGNGQFVVEEK